jgi:hypothetical protein
MMTTTRTKKTRKVITNLRRAGLTAIAVAALWLVPAFSVNAASGPVAQNELKPYALIFGTVWDKNDRPVYGIPVKIRLANQKKAKWELLSNHTGEFAQRVPAGQADYVVWLDIKGPKGAPKPQKTVHIENDERVDIGLHLTE